jgi:outer membrane receptor protein involved in Fe transport
MYPLRNLLATQVAVLVTVLTFASAVRAQTAAQPLESSATQTNGNATAFTAVRSGQQTDAKPVQKVDTVTITGTKRSQVQQEATQSVSVLNERDTISMQHGFDVFSKIPNVVLETKQFLPTVRGLDGNGVAAGGGGAVSGASPRMSSYVDGVARTYGAAPDGQGSFWDMAQVEVYRGAQSTLFGQNSIAGVMVQTTKNPVFRDEYAAQVGVRSERTTYNTAFMLNKAFGERFAVRVTGEAADGKNAIDYQTFAGSGLTAGDKDELGRIKYGRYRVKALYLPIDQLSLKFAFEEERRKNPYPPDIASISARRESRPDVYGVFDSNNRVASFAANYEFDSEWAIDAVLSQQKAKTKFGPPLVGKPDRAEFLDFTFTSDEVAFEPKLVYKSAQGRTSAVAGLYAKRPHATILASLVRCSC